ncbi:DUF4340 domain-containing protein [Bacteroidales bacterium OttesenSCG-928-K22]|nr:DUF4340 domain-containing protein [Bacteroidales bacterium OttesenSCG-928-K22]
MKKKSKIFTIILLTVIAIAAILLILKNVDAKNKDKVFYIENIDEINKIFFVDKSNKSILLEKRGSLWTVNERYYAVDEQVRAMLSNVRKLQVKEPVSRMAYDNVIGLLATTSTKVEFYGKGYAIDFLGIKLFPKENKLIKSFYVGPGTKDNLGTYMINENSDRPYIVYIPGYRGYLSPYFSTNIADWRAHFIFNHRIPQISSYKYIDNEFPEDSYILTNINSRNFSLKSYPDNVEIPYDTLKVTDLMSVFSNIRYEYLVNADTSLKTANFIDSIIETKPAHILTLTDKNGIDTEVKTYRMWYYDYETENIEYDRDRLYALIKTPSMLKDEDGNVIYDEDFVKVQYFVFDAVLRPLDWLKAD